MKKLKHLSFSILVLCVLHLSAPCNGEDESAAAPMKTTEQEALYSAIQGFVGKWWNGSDLYPDPCGWTPIQGVSCDLFDGFWYVTELSIGPVHDNSLDCAENVEFSANLFALKHLRSLSFFNCFVSPFSIPTSNWEILADSLESLEFRSNRGLMGQVPITLGELKNLKSFVIMENGLAGELPHSIGNLTALRRLNLAGNSFTGQIPDSFGRLSNLLILDMSRNALSGSLPVTFAGLNSLLKLDLSNNQLEGGIPVELGNLKNLTLLDLSNNRLSEGLTKSLQELSSLQELILSNNPTGGDIMNLEWQNLRSLIALDLSNMSLTGGIPESIGELTGLRYLGLNDNKLTGDIPANLQSLPNVSAMYIHGNNLTGELKLQEWFYRKMGTRFGAWGNPNLCCPTGLMSRSHNVPFGVRECPKEEVIKYETNLDFSSVASLGFSVCSVSELILLVEVLVILVLDFNF